MVLVCNKQQRGERPPRVWRRASKLVCPLRLKACEATTCTHMTLPLQQNCDPSRRVARILLTAATSPLHNTTQRRGSRRQRRRLGYRRSMILSGGCAQNQFLPREWDPTRWYVYMLYTTYNPPSRARYRGVCRAQARTHHLWSALCIIVSPIVESYGCARFLALSHTDIQITSKLAPPLLALSVRKYTLSLRYLVLQRSR